MVSATATAVSLPLMGRVVRIANRVAVADDVITNLEEIYDVSLDHAIEWSKAFRRAGTTKKWHQEIRMEPLT